MSNTSSSTVLVVDDQTAIRSILKISLENKGFSVLEACNGMECLKILHEKIVGLLILDLVMPVMDGLETMKKIQAVFQDRTIPVIMITGFANREAVLKMHELGCIDFVTKPFVMEEILKRVQKYLGNPVAVPEKPSVEGAVNRTQAGTAPDRKTGPDHLETGGDRENPNESFKIRDMDTGKLEEGMILGGDLLSPKSNGTLASAGVRLTARMIEKFRELGITTVSIKIEEPVQ
jgi:CheY-like chemotaxis protein